MSQSKSQEGQDVGATPGWSFYFWTPSASNAYELFVESLLNRDHDGKPRGLRVIGDSRTGKSSFLRNARQRLAVDYPDLATRLVVAEPPLESGDVEVSIRMALLIGANHPMALMFPKRDVVKSLSEKVLMQASGVAFDESHAFYKDKTSHFRQQASTFIRLAMNRRSMPFTLLGIPLLDEFIALNNELNNRLRPRAELGPFSLGSEQDEEIYRAFLSAAETGAPVGFVPTLREDQMVLRTFCASDGYPGHFMDLVNRVVLRAQRRNELFVADEHWEQAFADEFPERAAVFNPFEPHTTDELIRQIALQAEQRTAVSGPTPASRRSRRRSK